MIQLCPTKCCQRRRQICHVHCDIRGRTIR